MNGILKEKVKASGYKHTYLAGLIKVHPNYFSMVMRGDRFLSEKKESVLREILKDVQLPTAQVA